MKYHKRVFICPGAQKSGTTTLHDLLSEHPEITLSIKKETKYFINTDSVNLEEYFSNYFPRLPTDLVGEVDPDYMFDPAVPEKIFNVFGVKAKFIFLLRNPVERAYSHYWMSYRRGFETQSFEQAFDLEASRLANSDPKALWHQSYFARGFYCHQINQFLKFFKKENCLFVLFDDFVVKREESLKKILLFLGVDQNYEFSNSAIKSNESGQPKSKILSRLHGSPPSILKLFKIFIPSRNFRWNVIYPLIEKLNISKVKPSSMLPETKEKLTEYYFAEVLELEKLININLDRWRKI